MRTMHEWDDSQPLHGLLAPDVAYPDSESSGGKRGREAPGRHPLWPRRKSARTGIRSACV